MRLGAILFVSAACLPYTAQGAKLLVEIFGLDGKALPNIVVSAMGPNSTSAPSDISGRAEIELATGTAPGSWVTLYLVRAPGNYVIFAPMDGKVIVQSYATIWLCKPGDTKIIGSLKFVVSAVSAALDRAGTGTAQKTTTETDLTSALAAIAKRFSLHLEDLELAIHQLHDKSNDPYEQGVMALFERKYAAAAAFLEQAVKQSEDHKDPTAILNANLFFGQALYLQGEYKKAAEVFQKAAALRPDDAGLLTSFALSLTNIRDYAGAEGLFRRALAEREKELGADNPELARPITNLAAALNESKKFNEAAQLLQRALPLWEKLVGQLDPQFTAQLKNLATLFSNQGSYSAAIPYAKRQVELCKQAKGDHIECAATLSYLATLLYKNKDYAGAEPALTEALGIYSRKLSTYDPNLVTCYHNLAYVLDAKGDAKGAESNLRQALDLEADNYGPDSPELVADLIDLAELLHRNKSYAASAREYRRVLEIRKKNSPAGHRNVATALTNLGLELFEAGDYAAAAPLLNAALPLQTKYLGEGDSVVLLIRRVLAQIRDTASGTSR